MHTALVSLSENLADIAGALDAIDKMPAPTAPPPEEARRHLRWLRNLQATERDSQDWFDRGSEEEQSAKLQQLLQLISIYAAQLKAARAQHPAVLQHPGIAEANEAVQAMSLAALEHVLETLPEGHPDIARLEARLGKLPRKAELRLTQAVQHLLMLIETGIARVSGKAMSELSTTDRLVALSNQIHATARQLRSIDSLEPPVREEAIELAREILRRLKAAFDTKPYTETMSVGMPEDRLRLAEKIVEMVDVYRNLLSEAAQITPGIMNDPRIKEANDAVGGAAHAVSLMAAKEVPVSSAAAQQISADIEKAPSQWKNFNDRSVARLMKGMESGMEKAAEAVQEQAQDLQGGHDAMRRKRRVSRRSRRQNTLHKPATRRNAGDLNGDGVLDIYQGLNIKADDLALAKQLGDSLRGLGKQTADLPPLEIRPPIEKKSRSGKPFSAQEEDRDPHKHKPRGGQSGPGAG